MMCQRETGRTHAGDQYFEPVVGFGQVLRLAQGIPAGQQIIDLNAPGQ